MSLGTSASPARRRRLAVLILALVAVAAFGLGRVSTSLHTARAQAPATGYDIGVAGKTTPTGQVRTYELVASETAWEIAPGVVVPSIAYNGQVPGPTIRVMEGDTLPVTLKNELPKSTSIHLHGLHHAENDGVEPGGFLQLIQYEGLAAPSSAPAAPADPSSLPPGHAPGMLGMRH